MLIFDSFVCNVGLKYLLQQLYNQCRKLILINYVLRDWSNKNFISQLFRFSLIQFMKNNNGVQLKHNRRYNVQCNKLLFFFSCWSKVSVGGRIYYNVFYRQTVFSSHSTFKWWKPFHSFPISAPNSKNECLYVDSFLLTLF